jgi:hypothetical protein
LRRRANQWFLFARPALDQEGRFAVVTNVWCKDAMDASALKTNGVRADGEVVWSWHRDADAKLSTMLTHRDDDGGKKARSPGRSRRKP